MLRTNLLIPDRSEVYLQCREVYTLGTVQHMQCTCSVRVVQAVHTLPTHCRLQCTLHIHCTYTAYTLASYGSIFVHCTYTATCSLHCSYTGFTLPVHSTLIWDIRHKQDHYGTALNIFLLPWNFLSRRVFLQTGWHLAIYIQYIGSSSLNLIVF